MQIASKIVFFDMGNTLLHFHFEKPDAEKDAAGIANLAAYLRRFGPAIQERDVKTAFFDPWLSGISRRRVDYVEYPVENYLNAFMARYEIQLTLDECIVAMKSFYAEYRDNVWCEEDLLQTLSEIRCRGYKTGVISNSRLYDEVMIDCFEQAGLVDYIDSFTFSYYLRVAKPQKEIFQAALSRMSIKSLDVTMVGDSLKSDIKPAQELGWTAIWLNRDNKSNGTDIRPCFEIRRLKGLLDLL